MSRFKVADEAVLTLWNGLARELRDLVPPSRAADSFLRSARDDFHEMLAHFPEYGLAAVIRTAPGAGKPFLAIVVSDRFKADMALAAKRFYGVRSH
ncbi:hypothetical protein [Faunimonas sp. B44]|uniref:hypothetical protein n=1 Tax=Faunimonas sp. B44 TaxID=3461493 RepID=UPI0040440564